MTVHEEVFQDEVVRATDLNRSSGEILTKASRRPVTIVRNDETFALMRRDIATLWSKEASYATHLLELISNALLHRDALESEYKWLGAFESDQLNEMAGELIESYRNAIRTRDWETFDAILYEWSESGWAALNVEHDEAFHAAGEEKPVPSPG
jgi:hypothetical protein